jgi:Domain of unknown function (DUF1931)/BON domain
MATLDHVEIDALRAGMPVVIGGTEIGRLDDVLPQPDRQHVFRLITRRPDARLVAIPIEWVRGVRGGRIELWVTQAELQLLPEYLRPIPVEEARARVQRALDEHPDMAGGGIQVIEQNGRLELRGHVPDAATRATASAVARTVPGIGPLRNRLGTGTSSVIYATGYGHSWLHELLERTTGIDFDEAQIARIEEIAEQKVVDLFDVAEEVAAANGRGRVMRHDLPLTKGLQILLLEVADVAREFQLDPLLVFLADAGIRAPFDEGLRSDIPRLMAALLILTGRVVALLESPDGHAAPSRASSRALERAGAVLDLTL